MFFSICLTEIILRKIYIVLKQTYFHLNFVFVYKIVDWRHLKLELLFFTDIFMLTSVPLKQFLIKPRLDTL